MPRKLGQHFLTNKKKIEKIIDYLEIEDNDNVIEIGPGKGALTKELGKRKENISIIAVERDKKLIDYLNQNILKDIESKGSSIEIKYGNILTEMPLLSEELDDFENYKVIGNIPYYITGKLFRVFEEISIKPERIVLTIQKEVADRLIAEPPNMNILAASVQFWSDIEKLLYLPKKDFRPAPDVDSAVVRLFPKEYDSEISENYYKYMKMVFKHPRKTILNNLSLGLERDKNEIKESLINIEINPGDRPENLSIKNLEEIAKTL